MYDINTCHFTGTIQQVRPIQTRSGIAMTQFRISCWKEIVRCVCFKSTEIISMGNDSPAKHKHEIYHLMPMCSECSEKHPAGDERQKRYLYNAHRNR